MAKQGQKARSGRIVKHSHAKQFVVAATLAIIGIVVYVLLQQYTYQAKLEAELNNKRTQVQSQLKDLETKNNINADQQKQIDELNKQKQDLEKQLQAKAAAKTAYASAPPVTGVKGCGDDPYKAFIYSHESGCDTTSINKSSGACGLGQALPCSKMPCSLSDWACQDAFFTDYAMRRYGSWQNAYNFWQSHKWW